MALYLGIDGGGSGCRAAVCDASGRILGMGQAGPANIASDPDAARTNILSATQAALPAGASMGDLVAVMGLAGANVAARVERFSVGLHFARLRVETDAVTAAKGALGDTDGIVAAIGTGSVFAVQRSGNFRQIGGWGLVLGDEGSGAWIGRAVLAHALRAVDGFVADTPLTRALCGEYGGPDGIVAFAHSARPRDFAALAPRVTASADPGAMVVMALADLAVAAAIDLLQSPPALPVVFLGGLGAVYADRLRGRWPIGLALGTGLDGALRLARQTV